MTESGSKPQFVVGQTFTYPRFTEWTRVVDVPEAAAWAWLKEVVPQATICGYTNVTVEAVCNGDVRGYEWLNKVAVIIEVNPAKVVALYKHDDHISVLQRSAR